MAAGGHFGFMGIKIICTTSQSDTLDFFDGQDITNRKSKVILEV